MKLSVFLVIVCAAIAYSKKIAPNQGAMEKLMEMGKDCAAKEGATEADVQSAMAFKMPTTKTGKCLHACVGEAIKVLVANKLDVNGVLDMVKTAFGDDAETLKTAGEIANACSSVTDADRCESVVKIMECSDKELKSRGIEL